MPAAVSREAASPVQHAVIVEKQHFPRLELEPQLVLWVPQDTTQLRKRSVHVLSVAADYRAAVVIVECHGAELAAELRCEHSVLSHHPVFCILEFILQRPPAKHVVCVGESFRHLLGNPHAVHKHGLPRPIVPRQRSDAAALGRVRRRNVGLPAVEYLHTWRP